MNAAAATPFSVVILAAQRAGMANPLAARAGVSHKCLVPIAGKPLVVHVVDVLDGLPGLARVRVSVEPDIHGPLAALLAPYTARGMLIDFVAPSANIADSMLLAVTGQQAPYIITTADNVLLSRAAIAETLATLREADVVVNLATQATVQAVHPQAQRRFYAFRDGGYANCNLYGICGPHAFRSAEAFRQGGQFMRNPARLLRAFGIVVVIALRFRLTSLAGTMKLISRRFGLRIRAVVPADGAQAVDVDNERTYTIAEAVLAARATA